MKIEPSQSTPPAAEQTEKKINKNSRLITEYYGSLVLLLIAILIAAGFFIIKPKIDNYKDSRSQLATLNSELDNEQQYYTSLSRSVAAAQTISPDILQKVNQALPRGYSIPDILVQMGAASQNSGVAISNISFDTLAKPGSPGLQYLNMTLSVQSPNYATFKAFINSLELSLRLFDVQLITVSSSGDTGFSFTLQLRTYYFPQNSAVNTQPSSAL